MSHFKTAVLKSDAIFSMIFLTVSYFLSRLPFLRDLSVFYDSFEYLEIAEKLNTFNFSQVVSSSHQPIHTFYFITILIFKIIFFFIPIKTVLVLISFIFGYLTIVCWYLLVRNFISKTIALFSSLLVLVFPYFFVANTNILYESELLFFQIASLYLAFDGVKKVDIKKILIAGVLWGISQSMFIGSLIILPIFLWQFFNSKKRKTYFLSLFISTGIITPVIIDFIFLRSSLYLKYRLHLFDFVSAKDGIFIFLLRIVKNIGIETMAILSISGAIALVASLLILFVKNKKKFLTYLIWLIPPFFLMQYWHAGLFGRLSLFIIFPASLIISLVVKEKKMKIIVLILISLTIINYAIKQKQETPMNRFITLLKNSIGLKKAAVVTSDYNKFSYFENKLPTFVFNGLDENIPKAEKFILENLGKKRKILIDSAGLRFPYYQFDGDFYHILSLGKIGRSQAKKILEKFDFQVYTIDKLNPEIYFLEVISITNRKKIIQPRIFYSNDYFKINSNKTYSFDPLVNLFYFLFRKKDPDFWWYELRSN